MTTSSLTIDEVKHIATLAKLDLDEKEIQKFQKQLSETLDYVQILEQINTTKLKPTHHVSDKTNVYREDKTETPLAVNESVKNATRIQNNYFVIPSISVK